MIRRQLPAFSPIAPGVVVSAAWKSTFAPAAARSALGDFLKESLAADRVLLTDSGTHALQTAIAHATTSGPGSARPVALPAYSCFDVATAAAGAAAKVVFYDVDPTNLCPDPDSLRRALARGVGAVVANSLYGFPLDWTWLRKECDTAGALLIEDSAQGTGSSWNGRPAGSFGDLTVLSFGRGKGWTGGSGGALLLRGLAAEWAPHPSEPPPPPPSASVRALVLLMGQWALGRPALFALPSAVPGFALGETRYKEPSPPVGIPAFSASSALGHAGGARAEARERRVGGTRWRIWFERVGPKGMRAPAPLRPEDCGYLRFPVLADTAVHDLLRGRRAGACGIARGYPLALPDLPVAAALREGARAATPGALELARSLFTIPTHSRVTDADRSRIEAVLLRQGVP